MISNHLQSSPIISNHPQSSPMISNDLQWSPMISNDLQWSPMISNHLQWSLPNLYKIILSCLYIIVTHKLSLISEFYKPKLTLRLAMPGQRPPCTQLRLLWQHWQRSWLSALRGPLWHACEWMGYMRNDRYITVSPPISAIVRNGQTSL